MGEPALDLRHTRHLIDAVDALPSMPLVAQEVARLVHDPRSNVHQVAQVMRADAGLTAKVLKLVNSPYFAIPGGVSDIPRAVSFLGFSTLYQLVLTVSVFKAVGPADRDAADKLFRHSLGTAGAAEALSQLAEGPPATECFAAAVLHDLGRLALLRVAPDRFADSVALAREEGVDLCEAERRLDLPTHNVLGARLASRWRFPLNLRSVIAWHHVEEPTERTATPRHLHALIDLVLLADRMADRLGYSGVDGQTPELPEAVLARLGLGPDIEERAAERLQTNMARTELLMQALA